jgi:hypothetical protein
VTCSAVVELRQYELRPGQRDVLIELFDREFIEPQESAGMQVIGQFRDLDRPDRFVWLRGFTDMTSRRLALEQFYGGPVWKAHGDAANATMIDSDDVLLLRPVDVPSSLVDVKSRRQRAERASSTFAVTICSLRDPVDAGVVEERLVPALAECTGSEVAVYVDEPSENTFPALPVRTGEHVVVWMHRTDRETLPAEVEIARRILVGPMADPVRLRLQPTSRSQLQ